MPFMPIFHNGVNDFWYTRNDFLFLGNVSAIFDIWLVGDDFLREIFPAFQAMRAEARILKKTTTLSV